MNCSATVKILGIAILLSMAPAGCKRVATPQKPATAAEITGGVWKLTAIQRPGGAETAVALEPLYSIQFGADGRFSGQAYCNRHFGQYELRPSGAIALTGGASTRMMCLGESIEDEFLKTLGTITNYEILAEKLILSSGGGAKLTFTGGQ
jgi:heat shock protein HslJ